MKSGKSAASSTKNNSSSKRQRLMTEILASNDTQEITPEENLAADEKLYKLLFSEPSSSAYQAIRELSEDPVIFDQKSFLNRMGECRGDLTDDDSNESTLKFKQLIESNFKFTVEEIKNISTHIHTSDDRKEYLDAAKIPKLNIALRLLDDALYTDMCKKELIDQFKIENMPRVERGKEIARNIRYDMGISVVWRKNLAKSSIYDYVLFLNRRCFIKWLNTVRQKEVANKDTHHTNLTSSITTSSSNLTQALNDSEPSIVSSRHFIFNLSNLPTPPINNMLPKLAPSNVSLNKKGKK